MCTLRHVRALLVLLCALLLSLSVPALAAESYTEGDWTYQLLEDGSAMLTTYSGRAEELTIPSEIGGRAVTRLGRTLFSRGRANHVTIPSSVRYIDEKAFMHNTSLLSVTFSEGLESIGNNAFELCTGLTSLDLPDSLTFLGEEAFLDCKNLETVKLPYWLTYIGDSAFKDCKKLQSVVMPGSLQEVGSKAFYGCEQLDSVTFNPGLVTIGRRAFGSCKRLRNLTLPEGLQTIGEEAFSHCGLSRVVLPEGLVTISEKAFYYTKLQQVTFPSTLQTIGKNAFTENRMTSMSLPEGLLTIESYAFSGGILQEVVVPSTVVNLADDAFPKNVKVIRATIGADGKVEAPLTLKQQLERGSWVCERMYIVFGDDGNGYSSSMGRYAKGSNAEFETGTPYDVGSYKVRDNEIRLSGDMGMVGECIINFDENGQVVSLESSGYTYTHTDERAVPHLFPRMPHDVQ